MGGLNVLVRALAAGREPVVVPSIGGAGPFTDARLRDRRRRRRPRHPTTSGWPSSRPRCRDCCPSDRGHRARCSVHVASSSAGPRPVRRCGQRASDLGITLTTTYGATETAGGCVFDGRPLPGVTVTADGHSGASLTDHRGPTVALGYRGEPELTRAPASAPAASAPPTSARSGADGTRDGARARRRRRRHPRGERLARWPSNASSPTCPTSSPPPPSRSPSDSGEPAAARLRRGARRRHRRRRTRRATRSPRRLGERPPPSSTGSTRLPHLPNGKVDRRLLQQWAAATGTD